MGQYPNLLVTPPQQMALMKHVIEAHVKQLQLSWRNEFLGRESKPSRSYRDILDLMQEHHCETYQRAVESAETKFKKQPKQGTKTIAGAGATEEIKAKKPAKKQAKDADKNTPKMKGAAKLCQEAELAICVQSEVERQCYLELLRKKKNDTKATCPIESKWKADHDQCKLYLKMVEKARLGRHLPSEYLPQDATILMQYERTQEQTGKIDFDKLLSLFVALLQSNESVKSAFHQQYNYVVVDEYQDNSEVQSDLLLKIVTNGRVTVVGDDDQCIYGFRGASPGNFGSFLRHYAPLSPQSKLLENNYRSTANVLQVGEAFLRELAFTRGSKTLRPTREAGEKVEVWKCSSITHQAQEIAQSAKKRHGEGGVSWGQMACLFRCFSEWVLWGLCICRCRNSLFATMCHSK